MNIPEEVRSDIRRVMFWITTTNRSPLEASIQHPANIVLNRLYEGMDYGDIIDSIFPNIDFKISSDIFLRLERNTEWSLTISGQGVSHYPDFFERLIESMRVDLDHLKVIINRPDNH